jgi:3-dehydroquinate synthase
MRAVNVSLGDRSYRILIGNNLLWQIGKECRRLGLGQRCAVISTRNVAPAAGSRSLADLVAAGFDPLLVTIPAGETAKNLKTVHSCYDQLAAARLERNSFIVALGGGVVGDLGGFVAATYLRGVAFVQVPTHCWHAVDSSVGGKVGVNLRAGKNLVGAFFQPWLVLCDLDSLATLPPREFRAGLAEVIKYGIICDAGCLSWLERDLGKLLAREPKTLAEVVARCCAIKARVVEQDERKLGCALS